MNAARRCVGNAVEITQRKYPQRRSPSNELWRYLEGRYGTAGRYPDALEQLIKSSAKSIGRNGEPYEE